VAIRDRALHTLSSKWRSKVAAGVLLVLAATMAAPALAQQDIQPLLDRIDRLERDVNLLQRQVYRGTASGGGPAPVVQPDGSPLSTEVRIGQLEEQMRTLTGQLEEDKNAIEQLKHRLDTLSSDLDQRFSALGQGAAAAVPAPSPTAATPPPPSAASRPPALPPPPEGSTPGTANGSGVLGTLRSDNDQTPPKGQGQQAAAPAELPNGSPTEQYNYAFGLLRRADYPGAEQALKAFVKKYPNDSLAGNAQYWLGETYYVRKDYESAATAFALDYQKYPKGPKAADALLKLGMSLGSLGKKQDACSAFARLDRDFPSAPSNIKEREASERQQSGCS
jgi:tol-pal system protein YbgF